MPRRTHSEETRPVRFEPNSFDAMAADLHQQWAKRRQRDAERRREREQARKIEQFRATYAVRSW